VLAQLLAAVQANPDDVAPRLVYADALSDAGDPRGEFIALQCRGADRERQAELVAAHRDAWLGKLAPLLEPSPTEFVDGFLTDARVKRVPRPKLTAVVGNALWSTVVQLDFDPAVGGIVMKQGPVVRGPKVPAAAIMLAPVMRALRHVRGIDGDVFLTLCRDGDALPIRSVGAITYPLLERDARDVWRVADEPREAIELARGLPELRRLTLRGYPCDRPDLRWLLRSPLAGRLEQLRLDNFGGDLEQWVAMSREAHPGLGELVVDYWGHMRFQRAGDGTLGILELDMRALYDNQRDRLEAALKRVTLQRVEIKR
jgi:uncharacterized protein (TIGR02996 family)